MSTVGTDPVDRWMDLVNVVLGICLVVLWGVAVTPCALWRSARLVGAYELNLRDRRVLVRAIAEGYSSAGPCYACHRTWYQGCDHWGGKKGNRMRLWNGFLDVCAWNYGATRASHAPLRVFSRAYWSENWALTKKYPWANAAVWLVVAALVTILSMEAMDPRPLVGEGEAQFRWKPLALGMCIFLLIPLGAVALVRGARERRESGGWVMARSRARAAVGVLGMGAVFTGLAIALVSASLPAVPAVGIHAGVSLGGAGLTLLIADMAVDLCRRVWAFCRRRVARGEGGETGEAVV